MKITLILITGAGLLAAQSSTLPPSTQNNRILVQNSYYAQPGKADELYQRLLDARNVREKLASRDRDSCVELLCLAMHSVPVRGQKRSRGFTGRGLGV